MANKIHKFLEDWVINLIKNKDLFAKQIEKIEKKDLNILVIYKTKKQLFLIKPFISDMKNTISEINKAEDFIALVTFNTKENFDIIFKNWSSLNKNPKFSIYFINPFSKFEKKWIIYPHTHERITEKTAIKKGLLALFNTVEVTTEEEIKNILKEN